MTTTPNTVLTNGWLDRALSEARSGAHGWALLGGDGVVLDVRAEPDDAGCWLPMSAALARAVADEGGRVATHVEDDVVWLADETTPKEAAAAAIEAMAFAARVPDTIPADRRADWRAMLVQMAWHGLRGSDRVGFSEAGLPHWLPSAPRRHDGRPADRLVRLAQRYESAAEEMAENLGSSEWLNEIASRRAAARRRLITFGETLFGPEWLTPFSRLTEINLRTVQRWASGAEEPHFRWTADEAVRRAVARRAGELRRQAEALESVVAGL